MRVPDLGRFLFPRISPARRRWKVRALLAAALIGLVTAGVIILAVVLTDRRQFF